MPRYMKIAIFNKKNINFIFTAVKRLQFLVIKTLDLDPNPHPNPHWPKMLDPDPYAEPH
jgi:hypothetical protein